MVTLKDRAYAIEAQYAHEQSFLFCAQTRRNRLIGLWAAAQLGDANPEAYASALSDWSIEHFSDEELVKKLSEEFKQADRTLDMDGLATRMNSLMNDVVRDMRLG